MKLPQLMDCLKSLASTAGSQDTSLPHALSLGNQARSTKLRRKNKNKTLWMKIWEKRTPRESLLPRVVRIEYQ